MNVIRRVEFLALRENIFDVGKSVAHHKGVTQHKRHRVDGPLRARGEPSAFTQSTGIQPRRFWLLHHTSFPLATPG